jgi:hypothetical protein
MQWWITAPLPLTVAYFGLACAVLFGLNLAERPRIKWWEPLADAVDSLPIDIFNTFQLPATIPVVEKAIAARGSNKCILDL